MLNNKPKQMLAAVLWTALPCGVVFAQPANLPSGNMSSSSETSTLLVDCQPGATTGRAYCSIVQTMVIEPKVGADDPNFRQQLEKLKKSISKKALQKTCAQDYERVVVSKPAPTQARLKDSLDEACAKGDPKIYAEILLEHVIAVETNACTITTLLNTYEFTRLNENTWVHVGEPSGVCNASLHLTLWRNQGKDFWNYKQVRTVPPNEESKLCAQLPKTAEINFSWSTSGLRKFRCDYWQM